MRFKNLHDYFVESGPKVSRREIRDKLLEVTGKEKLPIAVSSSLKAKNVRGMFLSLESESEWVKRYGSDVIVISRDIFSKSDTGNYCWERFVSVKEMMHLFDTQAEMSDTGERFDAVISQFSLTYTGERTEQMASEVKCFWRALALLCPERHRLQFKQDFAQGKIDTLGIALKFRIPEQYVGNLLLEKYEEILEDALTDD